MQIAFSNVLKCQSLLFAQEQKIHFDHKPLPGYYISNVSSTLRSDTILQMSLGFKKKNIKRIEGGGGQNKIKNIIEQDIQLNQEKMIFVCFVQLSIK